MKQRVRQLQHQAHRSPEGIMNLRVVKDQTATRGALFIGLSSPSLIFLFPIHQTRRRS